MSPLDFVYLKRSWTFTDNQGLDGRQLAQHLKSENAGGRFRIAHMISAGSERAAEQIRDDVLDADEVLASPPDVLYCEAGLVDGPLGRSQPRVPSDVMERLLRGGTIVVVADLDVARAHDAADVWDSFPFFGARPRYDASRHPHYGIDQTSFVEYERRIICHPEEMSISPRLLPVYEGIERLEVLAPVVLETFDASVLATGNASTSAVLALDRFVDRGIPFVFATARQYHLGFAVLIAGGFSHDSLVDSTPDNARWLSNVIRYLRDTIARDRELSANSNNTVGEAATKPSVISLMAEGESDRVEFKSSCWYDIRTRSRNDERETDVLRAIAALANSSGGTLLIGVDDAGTVTGLEHDLQLVQPNNWDGFQLRLARQLERRLGLVGARLPDVAKERVGDQIVCRVDVPPSKQPVWLGDEELPVRSLSQSRRLRGREAHEYIRDHFGH